MWKSVFSLCVTLYSCGEQLHEDERASLMQITARNPNSSVFPSRFFPPWPLKKLCVAAFLLFFCQCFLPLPLFFFFFNEFIYLFLAVLGLCCCPGFSLVAASGGYSLLRCEGFSLRWLLLLQSMGSRRAGFSSCGTQAQ